MGLKITARKHLETNAPVNKIIYLKVDQDLFGTAEFWIKRLLLVILGLVMHHLLLSEETRSLFPNHLKREIIRTKCIQNVNSC